MSCAWDAVQHMCSPGAKPAQHPLQHRKARTARASCSGRSVKRTEFHKKPAVTACNIITRPALHSATHTSRSSYTHHTSRMSGVHTKVNRQVHGTTVHHARNSTLLCVSSSTLLTQETSTSVGLVGAQPVATPSKSPSVHTLCWQHHAASVSLLRVKVSAATNTCPAHSQITYKQAHHRARATGGSQASACLCGITCICIHLRPWHTSYQMRHQFKARQTQEHADAPCPAQPRY